MSSEIKKKIGTVPCPLCGVECAVKVNGRETLNYVCHNGCDNPGWAKAGTQAHSIIMKRMKPNTPPEAKSGMAASPVTGKPAPAAPEKKTGAGFFS